MKQLPLFDVPISIGTYHHFVESIISLAKSQQSHYVCVANVHMLVEQLRSRTLAASLCNATLVTPDGMPLTWALSMLHGVRQQRVAGMDLLPDLLNQAINNSLSVFFYGGTKEMLLQTEKFLSQQFPNLNVAGTYSPPFRALSLEEEQQIVCIINGSKAAIVFVILGCPKQEEWMGRMKGRVNSLMIGIGGALPVLIGLQNRAPRLIQKCGFEWLYRLFQEPSRLFKRYAFTNSVFVWLMFNHLFVKRLKNSQSPPP